MDVSQPGPARLVHSHDGQAADMDAIAAAVSKVGLDVVEVAGFLDDLGLLSRGQLNLLAGVDAGLTRVISGTDGLQGAAASVVVSAQQTRQTIDDTVTRVRAASDRSQRVALWVGNLQAVMDGFMSALAAAEKDLARIRDISKQVNILAINARIEAARVGRHGAGFAVIAEAIGKLSHDTTGAAASISDSIGALKTEAETIAKGATDVRDDARLVTTESAELDLTMSEVLQGTAALDTIAAEISQATGQMRAAMDDFVPDVRRVEQEVRTTADDILRVSDRSSSLIDTIESMVQLTVALGGASADQPFIDRVCADAQRLSAALETALDQRMLSLDDLFSDRYQKIPGSNPEQVLAPFTTATDRLFPPVQEAALAFSSRVVFCAAVDRNGYLPTHNLKFSAQQGADPVWNAANCRNRRIFNDRVGLKSGQNEAPFLLQVYRRDMGGGVFKIMKDVSAPIVVRGRHWGGLRLAYI